MLAELPDKEVVGKLFDTLAPRFAERPGGYTRILRVGFRRGDSAEVAHVELVGSEYDPAAADGSRGGREGSAEEDQGRRRAPQAGGAAHARGPKDEGGSKAQAGGQTRGKAQKSTTPRKAGGS